MSAPFALSREHLELAARTNLETVAHQQRALREIEREATQAAAQQWHVIEDLLSVLVRVGYRVEARCFGRDVSIVLTRVDIENNGVRIPVPVTFLTADQRALAADLVIDETGIDRDHIVSLTWEWSL